MATRPDSVKGIVLLVDDNPSTLELLTGILNENGLPTKIAKSGEHALESVKKDPPDLILLSVEIPGMDGYELCRKLKSDPFSVNIPVIFIAVSEEETLKGFEAGAVDYIIKPFHAREVLSRVRTHLSLELTQRHLQEALDERSSKLQVAREHFQKLFDFASEAFFVIGSDTRIIDVNQQACRSLGYTREELVALRVSDFEINFTNEELLEYGDVIEKEGRLLLEGAHRRKDGSTFPVEISLGIFQEKTPKLFLAVIRDVSERKAAEEKLRESEACLNKAQEIAKMGYWAWDLKTNEVIWSDGACSIHGLKPGAFDGTLDTAKSFIHPEDLPRIQDGIQILLKEKKHIDFEYRIITLQGVEKILSGSQDMIFGDDGEVLRLFGIFQDITDRKLAKDALKTSEERYRQMFAANLAVKLIIDPIDGRIVEANKAAQKFYGYDMQELCSMRISEINILPEQEVKQEMERARNEERLFFSFRHRLASGEIRDVEVYSGPIKTEDETLLYSIIHDVTDRKKAEEKVKQQQYYLEKAQELGQIGTWELDLLQNKLVWTDENYRIFGLPIGAELDYESFLAVVHPDDRGFVDKKWNAGIEGESYDIEHRLLIDGVVKWVREKAELVYDADGKAIRAIGFTHDITERKHSEEELQRMRKLESVGTLAGGIAHDFNNILTGIFNNLLLAKETLSREHPGFKLLEESEKSMDRAVYLTNQLLTFAKGGEPVRGNVSLEELIKETASFDLSGSNVKAIFEIAEDLNLANVDKGQMHQVFSNLIINADHAMPSGGCLYISLENAELEENTFPGLSRGNYVKISVRDEGIGVGAKYLNRIFDPYFTTKQNGSGLGLATVYSIIKRHNGFIKADSEIGVGTTFTIYLPALETPAPAKQNPGEIDEVSKMDQGSKVLVMDDEEMILFSIALILKSCGCSVETATDGEAAFDMYKLALEEGEPFDLILMDLTIPGGLGGKETIGKLLEIDPGVKCVVSSGYSNDPIMANYREYGFKGIIAKPYTPDKLREILNQVLSE